MWSKQAVGEDANGNKVYTDGYHIVDAANRAEAESAPGLPVRNSPLSDDGRYKRGPIAFSILSGPTQWVAILTYAIPSNGNFPDPGDDPLLRPFRWNVQKSWVERPSEVDANRRPKKNSAGDFFQPTPKKYRRRILVGTRYERFWDLAKSELFENTTNLNQISLGPITIAPGAAMCHSIEPAGEFEGDADYLLMEYAIEVATDERAQDPARPNDPPDNGFPFDTHQLDIGNFGWFLDPTTSKLMRGRFCYATGTTATSSGNLFRGFAEDVQLDGTGMPYYRGATYAPIYVTPDDGTTIYTYQANPNTAEWLATGTQVNGKYQNESPYSTTANRMWLFPDCVRRDWTNLFTLSAPPNPLPL